MRSTMEKFIVVVILWMCGDKLLTSAFPQWVFEQDTTLHISMVDATDCTDGIADISAASNTSQTISYSVNDPNFSVTMDMDTYTYKLYCNYAALMAQPYTVHTVAVTASDPGGSILRTFILTLIERYAPVFGQNEVTLTHCDLSGLSVDDVLHTVNVTDADPDDVVTIEIISSGTPFVVTDHTGITIHDVPTLVQFLTTISSPYTLDVRAVVRQSRHTADGTIQIRYDNSDEDCRITSDSPRSSTRTTNGVSTTTDVSTTNRATGSSSNIPTTTHTNDCSGDGYSASVLAGSALILITHFLYALV